MIRCPDCQTENLYSQLKCRGCQRSMAAVIPGDKNDPYLGQRIARDFLLRRNLGSGEIGIVYEAVNEAGSRRVAIKILHEDVAEAFGEELLRWAKRAAQLRHKKIASILAANRTEQGITFIVTEFVEGDTLMALLKRNGPLEAARTADILFQLCSALAPIHKAGRPHANLKPENVFISQGDDGKDYIKIVDVGSPVVFGAHHLSGERQVVGAPKYFSPEQASGESVGLASDQFTLGVIGYLLLTGALPFFGATPDQLLDAIIKSEPKPITDRSPNVPEILSDIVHRCLAKKPEDRFTDLRSIAKELATVIKLARRNELQPTFGESMDDSIDMSGSLEADRTVLLSVPTAAILDLAEPDLEQEPTELSAIPTVDHSDAHLEVQEAATASVDIPVPEVDDSDLSAAFAAAEALLDGQVEDPPAAEPEVNVIAEVPEQTPVAPEQVPLPPEPASEEPVDSASPPEEDLTESEDLSEAMSAALNALSGATDVGPGGSSLDLDDAFAEVSAEFGEAAGSPDTGSLLGDDLISDIDDAISITQSGRRPTNIPSESAAPVASVADFGEVSTMSDKDKKSRLMSKALATVRPENLSRPWVLVFLFCLLVIAAMTAQIIHQDSLADEERAERLNLRKRLAVRAKQEVARKKRRNVLLVTAPAGADVYLGSVLQGRSPMNIALLPGKVRKYVIKLKGHESVVHILDPAEHPGGGITLEQRIVLQKSGPKATDAGSKSADGAADKSTAVPPAPLKKAKVITTVINNRKEVQPGAAPGTPKTKPKPGKGAAKKRKPKRKASPTKRVSPGTKKAIKKPPVRRVKPRKRKPKNDDIGDNPFD